MVVDFCLGKFLRVEESEPSLQRGLQYLTTDCPYPLFSLKRFSVFDITLVWLGLLCLLLQTLRQQRILRTNLKEFLSAVLSFSCLAETPTGRFSDYLSKIRLILKFTLHSTLRINHPVRSVSGSREEGGGFLDGDFLPGCTWVVARGPGLSIGVIADLPVGDIYSFGYLFESLMCL